MRESNYNIIVEKDDRLYCFNASTFSFFKLKRDYKSLLCETFSHPDERLECLPHFKSVLMKGRFVVDDQEDELAYLYRKNQEVVEGKHYKLTILPTFACNFHCWYCVQHHKRESMTDEVVDLVKRHVQYMVEKERIESLSLEWFGGEPLLGFEKVIEPITSYAQGICDHWNIPFSTGMTTNGYLFNREILERMKPLNMVGCQITLDGLREYHDQTRVAPHKSSFDGILERVNLICEILENAYVTLRINYDDKNFDPDLLLSQINERVDEKYKNRIYLLLRKVWQVKASEENRLKNIQFVQEAKRLGFRISSSTFLNMNYVRCYANRKYYNTIAPDGGIYKCTAKDDYSKDAYGRIKPNGEINWSMPDFEKRYFGYRPFENKECAHCKYLPLCWNNCPRDFELSGLESLPNRCVKSRQNDLSFEEAILEYCELNN